MARWWEKWEGRLESELRALDAAGIPYTLDVEAQRLGFIRLALLMETEIGQVELTAFYPEHYPYFRVQVSAPTLELRHHQNPFAKNLCLLGRRTHFWNPSQTLASLVVEQMPKLLVAAEADAPPEDGLEAQQGEPVSEYFPYQPSAMVIVQSDWTIPDEHRHGTLTIATEGSTGGPGSGLLRGVVSEIRDSAGKTIVSADARLLRPYAGPVVKAVWVRASQIGRSCKQEEVYQALVDDLPALSRIVPPNTTAHGYLRVIGALFDEETAYRRTSDGWLFACRLSPIRTQKRGSTGGGGLANRKKKKR